MGSPAGTREQVSEEQPLPFDAETWAAVASALELSPQQVRIVEGLLRAMRDKQIAQATGLRVPTVRTYFERIFRRVGVRDRVELLLKIFTLAFDLLRNGSCHRS
ncbi:MAG: hypothetical protein KJ057_16315 [Phycisphaerae bacterium]|nr:hypothetical protein [Planctomycetia bacterium]MCL4720033.1 hypothetical protein [Phycisphaerae bacterium]